MLSLLCENDLVACACLFKEVYTGSPWYHSTVTDEKALRYLQELSKAPGFLGFVYWKNRMVAGMVLGTVNDYFFEPQYEIKELAVSPRYQRQGIGMRMLAEAEHQLAERGIVYMLLQTSNEIPAFEFYVSSGYVRVDATVSMAKMLKK